MKRLSIAVAAVVLPLALVPTAAGASGPVLERVIARHGTTAYNAPHVHARKIGEESFREWVVVLCRQPEPNSYTKIAVGKGETGWVTSSALQRRPEPVCTSS